MEKKESLEHLRHSLAHLLAAAVLELYPDTKTTIGPAIENGFYYDLAFTKPIGEDDLPVIEAKMREILPSWHSFEREEVSAGKARESYANNPYKLELIDEIVAKGEPITLYHSLSDSESKNYKLKTTTFFDLCRGGHAENPSRDINPEAFALTRIAGAYWRGDEKNIMLTRIYGVAFSTKEELEHHLAMEEEAKKRDHRKLGKELGLFMFSEAVGKGLPLWTEKGATLRRILERFIVDEEIKRDYKHVYTPDIANLELYKKSGHYPYYKESMYSPIRIDDEEYMLRPMTCPHHFELYLDSSHSYRELPIRYAEIAKLYRYEQSGELSGLMRVRTFSLADSHIICADETQAKQEIAGVLDLIEYVANVFGLKMGRNYSYRLSLGDRSDDKKYFKDDAAWDGAEARLREVLKERGCHFIEAHGEAAFYGPKIDVQMKNVREKEDTAFTVQYDFVMPKRFHLTYTAADGHDKEAVVIHRSSIGAIERIIAFLIEYYGGAFPLWLSPVQVSILPIGEGHAPFAREVFDALKNAGIRAELDESNETLGKKIREWKLAKIPYACVIGDKEIESGQVTVESRDAGKQGASSIDDLLERLKKEIEMKK